jgi:hypothetical protein
MPQDIAILMFKVKNNISPLYVNRIFETVDNYGLRNADFHIDPVLIQCNMANMHLDTLDRIYGPFWAKQIEKSHL